MKYILNILCDHYKVGNLQGEVVEDPQDRLQ